ncbi:MAG: Cro/CI family transcriptional regulator [Pseudomonadales bacterium]|nr:Cro/CI family transcriptional regulator [Pseudomonadales bacterium]
MTDTVTLTEYAKDKTQNKVAEELGVTQAGLRKMLLSGRDIYIQKKSDGTIEAFEIRSIPARKNNEPTAA